MVRRRGQCSATVARNCFGSRVVSSVTRTMSAPPTSGPHSSQRWSTKSRLVLARQVSPAATGYRPSCQFTRFAKPRWVISTGFGVPVEPDIQRFLEEHPADPGLYSFHVFRSLVLKDTVMSAQAIQARESSLQELTKRLFFMHIKKAEEAGVTLRLILDQRATGAHADDRRWALEQVCNDHHVEFDILPRQTAGSDTRFHGDACALLARKACYEFDFDRDPEMVAIRSSNTEELQTTDPLIAVMVRILGDSSWLGTIKEKALMNTVPVREMLRRDAQYSLDHYAK